MIVQVRGIIEGKHIELEHETSLPFGSQIVVNIESQPLPIEEKRSLVDSLCGAWAGDSSLSTIFAGIEQQRSAAMPREVNFNAAS